ncbi:MAG: penicillin-binding protein 2 [bacterium]|nr:penicillin-binding protein 2 [bacterium]
MSRIREDPEPLRRRTAAAIVGVSLMLFLLLLRLAYLQIINGAQWQEAAENNRVRRIPVGSERGRIFDRRGSIVAENQPAWQLLLFPDEAQALDQSILFLSRLDLGSAASLHERVRGRRGNPMAPILMGEDLTWEQVASVRAHQGDYPELSVVSGWRRHYPFGGLTAHAVGYLRLARQEELLAHPEWMPDTHVGAIGVEALFDESLGGEQGERWIVTNAIGRQLGMVHSRQPSAGTDISVTLDIGLQSAAAQALGDESGAVVALDPISGAVRVLYSSPSFDPNVFVEGLSLDDWRLLRDDPEHPLQNRAIQGVYPPGSTIKPMLALAGLTEGTISPNWRTYCRGAITLFNHPFRCWRRGGHGTVGLEKALEVSCDVYFYQLGQQMGIEALARWLSVFEFGKTTGLGLANEHSGLIGTPEWSRRVRGTPWYPGEVISMSIGQGPVLVTVLQMARGFAALANHGRLIRPFLVERESSEPQPQLTFDANHFNRVISGLTAVTQGREGTARSLAYLPIAGKTGTAQVARLQDDVPVEKLDRRLRHHAWFVGWAPLDKPSLVVAVLVEHGGGGAAIAAPVAGKVIAAHLGRQ